MTRFNRGIAGERAAVREAQREAARQLEEEARRRRPSLGDPEPEASAASDEKTKQWLPGKFVASTPWKASTPSSSSRSSGSSSGGGGNSSGSRGSMRERADILPLAMHRCLDMDPIRKGSFFFMSSRYVEEVEDWCRFDEDLRGATF